MKNKFMAALCVTFACVMAVSAADPKAGGILIYGKPKDARALDPGAVDEGNSSMIITNLYEPLLCCKPGTSDLIPCLAKSYTISKNSLEITFHLRQGVKFHDGTTMDADAVVFSLKRQNDKANPFNKYGPWKYWSGKGWSDTEKEQGLVKDIVKVDNATVKVLLNRVDNSIMYNFALYFTSVVSPTAVQKYGADFKNHPCGTGPFMFSKWVKDDQVVLKRFDDYWGEKAHLDGVIFKVFPDEQARILALAKGEADVIDPTGPEGMKTIEAYPNLKFQQGDRLNVGYLSLNCAKGPFTDIRLRQAVCYGVNRKEILDNVFGKTGVHEKLPMPSTLWGYDKSIPDYDYNPEKAKALIKASGAKLPIKANMIYLPAWRPYNPNGKRIAEIMQAQLKPLGFDITIQTYEMGTYWDKIDTGDFEMGQTGWNGQGDPDDWFFNLFTEGYNNSPQWRNKEFIDLVTQAKQVQGIPARSKLYYKAEKILMAEAPILMIARGIEFRPMNKKVNGYVIYPDGHLNLALVWMNK